MGHSRENPWREHEIEVTYFSEMALLLIGLMLFGFLRTNVARAEDVKTVDELDLPKYMGRWYEMYNSFIQRQTFQKDSFCSHSDYKLVDGKVDVVNAARKKSVPGVLSETHGIAERPNDSVTG